MIRTNLLKTEFPGTLPNGKRKAIIIGAGPAGLTAAYELLKRTDIVPVIIEKSGDIGGISKTVNYKGNRIDIGGHRFFSKSDRVMNWWLNIMPVQNSEQSSFSISYQHKSKEIHTDPTKSNGADPDKVMLVRKRLSRIYFLRKFFTYPIQLSFDTLKKLGLWTTLSILFSYLKAQLFPHKPERNLEDFMINRFGYTLYNLFFKDYTEKVWGVPCQDIPAEWGAQRIKGISISKAIQHAVQSAVKRKTSSNDIAQKDTETSLIEQFLYPKFGPGQLWEEVARQVESMGGKILMHQDVKRIYTEDNKVIAVAATNHITGETSYLEGDYFFSTMPVQELIGGLDGPVPADVKLVASGLQYRDFITVGILLKKLSHLDKRTGEWKALQLKDTWIYIQEKDVKVGRLQLFNNWSPYMVKDPDTVWVGMEFFCNQTDDFWKQSDAAIQQLAIQELEKIGLANEANVLDATVLRMEKTYPAYFGSYDRFDVIRKYVDAFENLFLVGRNGMHKYNNSDHSMLTAMVAVDNICEGVVSKENIWGINTEQEYHEEKVDKENLEHVGGKFAGEKVEAVKLSYANISFGNFLVHDRLNKKYLVFLILALVCQFTIFKYFYPYPSFINGDSYAYLQAASLGLNISTYPIGYSKFLSLVRILSNSDTVLVAIQYFLLQASILFYTFTIFYFYSCSKLAKFLLFAFVVLNPVFLYLSNYVSSDALFVTLSLIWFTLLLWILNYPTAYLIIVHSLILLLAFMVRYNALFYPVVICLGFLLSRQQLYRKVSGILLGLILIGCFVLYTTIKYYKLTGEPQFSPFTGWQVANNAMYAYRYIDSASVEPMPDRFKGLDEMVRAYFDSTRDLSKHPEEGLIASTMYMWDNRSPLVHYMNRQFRDDSAAGKLKRWATVAPLYARYGSHLIWKYPLTFTQYYLWPNFLKYYAPPVEFLGSYSMGIDTVQPVAQEWFGYKSNRIIARVKDFEVSVLNFYPILIGALNVLFVCSIVCFVLLNGYKKCVLFGRALSLATGFWLVNLAFSVFASPVALRFQLFPVIILISFSILLIDYVSKITLSIEVSNRNMIDKREE